MAAVVDDVELPAEPAVVAYEELVAVLALPLNVPVIVLVTFKVPVTSVFELIETNVPVSVTLLSPRCSSLTDLSNLLFVGAVSLPKLLKVCGPINNIDDVIVDWF